MSKSKIYLKNETLVEDSISTVSPYYEVDIVTLCSTTIKALFTIHELNKAMARYEKIGK